MNNYKNYEDLTIKDPFMFGKICSKPENRKLILDALLSIDLHENSGEIEKQIQVYRDSKFSRLDLLVEDDSGTVYNAEMQNESRNSKRQEELPKRSRYYQSLIDTAYFESGKDYMNLPDSYIVFICTFDPFKKGLPIYTFDIKCAETDIPNYQEGTHKIFFNTTADLSNLPQDTQNMLQYIESGATNDDSTKALDIEVEEARFKEEWKAEYMLTLVHDTDVYRDGYDAATKDCQNEIDSLNDKIDNLSDANLNLAANNERLIALLKAHGIDPNEQ